MKRYKKVTILLLLVAFALAFSPVNKVAKGGEGYGVVNVSGTEMYRDTYGNLYPIEIGSNGEKLVILNRYEVEPLKVLLKRDARISKGGSELPDFVLKGYYDRKNSSTSTSSSSYVMLPAVFSYKQGYHEWESEPLGFDPVETIGEYGCFLTSCAMALATYGLTINGRRVDPLNLNSWLKDNDGFGWAEGHHDALNISALDQFPGVKNVTFFNYWDAPKYAIAHDVVPIIAVHHPQLHFCVLVRTNGVKSRKTNYILNTYDAIHGIQNDRYAMEHLLYANGPYYNITKQTNYYYTLEQVGYYFADPGTGEYSIGRIIWPDW